MGKLPQNIDKQINLYFAYLEKLKQVCKRKNIKFSLADRILYMVDKRVNKKVNIKV